MADEIDGAIRAVLTNMGEHAKAEARQSPQYQELESCPTVSHLIDHATHMMMGVVLDVTDILRERGETVDTRAYAVLQALPLLRSKLTAAFAAQTSVGCVDRARAVTARMVTDPAASVTLLMERPGYCTGNPSFCPEHGWGAHEEAPRG